MNIDQLIEYITNYRNGLKEFLKKELAIMVVNEVFLKEEHVPDVVLTTQKVMLLISELELCDTYLDQLHAYNTYMNSRGNVITSADHFLHQEHSDNYWKDLYKTR